MKSQSRIGFGLFLLLGFSSGPVAQAPSPSGTPTYLDQGWTDTQRQQFYTTTQGSQLIPLAWFLALERPGSEELFVADELSRFGFLPNPKSSMNPNGLPVGFTEDPNGGGWAGLTCSACHTGQVEYRGTIVRIDGGPSSADVLAFVTELNASLQSTLSDTAKFDRFAAKVAGSDPRRQHDLRNQLTRFAAYFSTFLDTSTPESPWGPARVDAFGMIFNRTSAIDLSDATVWSWFQPLESNSQKPNAPVSYPFLWGTSRQDHVQWNAVAKNKLEFERLGRNIGEALGVFARVNIKKPTLLDAGYTSTVNIPNQLMIEETLVHSLKSPQWPAATLGQIDQPKAAQGSALYNKFCVSCHIVVDRNATSPVTVKQVPIGDVATDPTMAMNVACRMADTGVLAGSKQPPVLGPKLKPQDYIVNLVANEGLGVLEAWLASGGELAAVRTSLLGPRARSSATASDQAQATPTAAPRTTAQLSKTPVPYELTTGSTGNCTGAAKVYKAGPLSGIWATAPYLHNGSVPTLYHLLHPGERPARFFVGNREYDPAKVGYQSESAGANVNTWVYDTTKPGNGNIGHSGAQFGTTLAEDQKAELLEYLKQY
jgi:hypothetical protein